MPSRPFLPITDDKQYYHLRGLRAGKSTKETQIIRVWIDLTWNVVVGGTFDGRLNSTKKKEFRLDRHNGRFETIARCKRIIEERYDNEMGRLNGHRRDDAVGP